MIANASKRSYRKLHQPPAPSPHAALCEPRIDVTHENWFTRIAHAAPAIIYVFDRVEQRNVYSSQQIFSFLGYTPEEVRAFGSNVLKVLMHPDDFREMPRLDARQRQLRDGEVMDLEYRMQNSAGDWRWLHSRELVWSRDANGEPKQILGFALDISDQKAAEKALADRARALTALNASLRSEIRMRRQTQRMQAAQYRFLLRSLHRSADSADVHSHLQSILAALVDQLAGLRATLWDRDGETLRERAVYQQDKIERSSKPISVPLPRSPKQLRAVARAESTFDAPTLYIPLIRNRQLTGAITITLPRKRIHSRTVETAKSLQMLAANSLDLVRLADDARRSARLEERHRLASEFHDAITQCFAGVLLQLDVALNVVRKSPLQAEKRLHDARNLARSGLDEARRALHALRPAALADADLTTALTDLAKKFTSPALTARFSFKGRYLERSAALEEALYRICEEALRNASRHSQATTVDIQLRQTRRLITLAVRDNGVGLARRHRSSGFGLGSMTARAEAVGGKVSIKGAPGKGVTVQFTLPLTT